MASLSSDGGGGRRRASTSTETPDRWDPFSSDHRRNLSGGVNGGGGRRRASTSTATPDRWDPTASPFSTSSVATVEKGKRKVGGFFKSMRLCFGVSEKASSASETMSKNSSCEFSDSFLFVFLFSADFFFCVCVCYEQKVDQCIW